MSGHGQSDDDDFADFTISSIDHQNYDPANDTINHPHSHSQRLISKPSLNHTRSAASLRIQPHRKSSIIIAQTGHKIQRSYSTWNYLASPQIQSQPTIPSQTPTLINNLLRWNNLKSAFAYFLASLVIYIPQIANLLGNTDSKHLTCTVVVYFHPSRTIGSMIQTILFVLIALSFSITVTFTTYALQYYFQFDSPFFILTIASASLGIISYFKQKVGRQTFNTSSSLAAIVIISCLIKIYSLIFDSDSPNLQFPVDRIQSVIYCVGSGCLISVIVCFTLWKTWAHDKLISQIVEIKSLTSHALALLTDAFTKSSSKMDIDNDRIIIADHFKIMKSKLAALDTSLEEFMYECYLQGHEKQYHLHALIVRSLKKLVNHLGGLRRAVEFKWELIEYYDKIRNGQNLNQTHPTQPDTSAIGNVEDVVVEKPEELIDLFLYHLGPSIKSFVYTMNEILADKMFSTNKNKHHGIDPIVVQYNKSLELAKSLFEQHQRNAVDSLYQQEIFVTSWNVDVKINQEEVAATCANFSFSITQISNEVENLLSIMTSLYNYHEQPHRTFEFLKLWKYSPVIIENGKSSLLTLDILSKHDSNTHSWAYKLWKLGKFTRSNDFQFGLRVGMGALLLGSLAFFDATRHWFIEYRGEWTLVTYCIIMNKSLGGTAMTVKWRFLGTFIGAVTAYTVWTLFYPNVIAMSILGLIVSIPCFDIILNWKANNPFGRFILLTYNLTVLYSYTMSLQEGNPSDSDDWEGGGSPIIWEIAFHRYLAVSLGVFWALLITMTLLPVTARNRIKQGLSIVWIRLGLSWKKGALYIQRNMFEQDRLDGLSGLSNCHVILAELRVLLKQAPMEMRLKGEFPLESYSKLITGTENILDSYENINSIIDMDPLLNPVESIVLMNLKDEMNELQNRVFLVFYMLASAMKLGLPIASDPATTENAMMKMLIKLADVRRTVEARKELGKSAGLKNDDFVLFYTYCLVTNSIVHQLDALMKEVVHLFGKIDEESLDLN